MSRCIVALRGVSGPDSGEPVIGENSEPNGDGKDGPEDANGEADTDANTSPIGPTGKREGVWVHGAGRGTGGAPGMDVRMRSMVHLN